MAWLQLSEQQSSTVCPCACVCVDLLWVFVLKWNTSHSTLWRNGSPHPAVSSHAQTSPNKVYSPWQWAPCQWVGGRCCASLVRADTCLWTCVIQALWARCIYPSQLYRAAHLKHEHDLFSEGIRANPSPAFSYIHMQRMRWGSKWLASFNVFKLWKKREVNSEYLDGLYVSRKFTKYLNGMMLFWCSKFSENCVFRVLNLMVWYIFVAYGHSWPQLQSAV